MVPGPRFLSGNLMFPCAGAGFIIALEKTWALAVVVIALLRNFYLGISFSWLTLVKNPV